jgi:lipopolysaccharide transport system permease protein
MIEIEAGKTEAKYWKDIWLFRELFYILAWRDIKVRYKQTALGLSWSIIRPLLSAVIMTAVFNYVAKLRAPTDVPYVILVMSAMLPWQFFTNSFSEASNSLIGNSNLISKVYFPRLVIPASSIVTSLVDFLISFGLLLAMMVYYQFIPSVNIVLMPLFLLLALSISLGVGLFGAALNVKYRDFRYVIPFIIQLGVYITPVGYSSSEVPEKWRLLYSLNPMVAVIDGFRWCILGREQLYVPSLYLSIITCVLFLYVGISYFRKTEKSFSDNI